MQCRYGSHQLSHRVISRTRHFLALLPPTYFILSLQPLMGPPASHSPLSLEPEEPFESKSPLVTPLLTIPVFPLLLKAAPKASALPTWRALYGLCSCFCYYLPHYFSNIVSSKYPSYSILPIHVGFLVLTYVLAHF